MRHTRSDPGRGEISAGNGNRFNRLICSACTHGLQFCASRLTDDSGDAPATAFGADFDDTFPKVPLKPSLQRPLYWKIYETIAGFSPFMIKHLYKVSSGKEE